MVGRGGGDRNCIPTKRDLHGQWFSATARFELLLNVVKCFGLTWERHGQKQKLRLPRMNQRRKGTQVSPSSEWAKPHQQTARALSEENPLPLPEGNRCSRTPARAYTSRFSFGHSCHVFSVGLLWANGVVHFSLEDSAAHCVALKLAAARRGTSVYVCQL